MRGCSPCIRGGPTFSRFIEEQDAGEFVEILKAWHEGVDFIRLGNPEEEAADALILHERATVGLEITRLHDGPSKKVRESK